MATMTLDDREHPIGDCFCNECWTAYPKDCTCGGLVHASFGDEDADMNYWLYLKCDQCGDQHEETEFDTDDRDMAIKEL